MYLSPLVFSYLYKKLLQTFNKLSNIYNSSKILNLLYGYYLNINVWFFFKNILLKSQGSLTNSLINSYSHWTVNDTLEHVKFQGIPTWTRTYEVRLYRILTEVKVVPFNLQKVTFDKLTFLILLLLLQIYPTFLNRINITYAFLLVSRYNYFFPFYSCFYFKIYNY